MTRLNNFSAKLRWISRQKRLEMTNLGCSRKLPDNFMITNKRLSLQRKVCANLPMTSTDPNRQKLTQLRKLLIQHFSLDELRVLCFDLGLEYEELPGSTRTTKMHGHIEYFQHLAKWGACLA